MLIFLQTLFCLFTEQRRVEHLRVSPNNQQSSYLTNENYSFGGQRSTSGRRQKNGAKLRSCGGRNQRSTNLIYLKPLQYLQERTNSALTLQPDKGRFTLSVSWLRPSGAAKQPLISVQTNPTRACSAATLLFYYYSQSLPESN